MKCQYVVDDYLTHLLTSCRITAEPRDAFWATVFDEVNVHFAVNLFNLDDIEFVTHILQDNEHNFQQSHDYETFQELVLKFIQACLDAHV